MAAVRPRITFTPDDDTLHVLNRLSELQGRRPSAIVTEFMQAVTPSLEDIADQCERVQQAQDSAKAAIGAASEAALAKITPHAEAVSAVLGQLVLDIDAALEPPSSNTGATVPTAPPPPASAPTPK